MEKTFSSDVSDFQKYLESSSIADSKDDVIINPPPSLCPIIVQGNPDHGNIKK